VRWTLVRPECIFDWVDFVEVVMYRRSLAPVWLALSLVACASAPTRRADRPPEISFDLDAPPARAREQIQAAFAANGLPVASSQPGVVEFHSSRERGVLGSYEVFARAVIVPADCGTHVTLFGEETHFASATATQGTATRIGPSSTGRALEIWRKLENVAGTLRRDAVAVPRPGA
jgi:hypothetical protein